MVKKFPNVRNEMDTQIQEAQKDPNQEKPTLRHTLIKLLEDTKRIVKAADVSVASTIRELL